MADTTPRERPGRILAAERERQGLGPADIAQRLHMSVSQIEALEADNYSMLPRGTFLRGFVRNYAKALGMPSESLLSALAEGAPREPAPGIVVPSQNIRFEGGRIPVPYIRAAAIAGTLLVFGFAAMYWFLFVRPSPPATAARRVEPAAVASKPAPAPTPAPVAAPPVTPPPIVAEAPKLPEPPKVEPKKVEPPKVEAPKLEAPKAAPPRLEPVNNVAAGAGSSLKFRFAGKSWVEIKDSGGKILMTGLNDAGSEAEVVGKPPFRVTVGNAPEVRMYYNDREFNLAPHMREAVARVTVE